MTENPMQVAVEMAPLTDTPDAPVATVTPYDDDLEPSRGSVWHRRAGTFGAAALVTIIVLLAVYLATRALQKSDGSEGDGSEVHEWTPADAPLITIWGETGVPDAAPGYPRPLLTRADDTWRSLNGLWEFDASPASLDRPPFNTTLPLRILVPYPVESPLSGVRSLTAHGLSWYRLQRATSDLLPDGVPCAESTLLHFEASDWNTTVWIDGALLGSHAGGYDPFSFDVTAAFAATSDDDGAVEIIVGVADATSDAQAVGKQWVDAFSGPSGVRYTPTSGLWATVWLECAPAVRVDSVRTDTTNLAGAVALAVSLIIADGGDGDSDGLTLHATARDAAGGVVASASTSIAAGEDRVSLALDLDAPVALWSPQTPHLYSLELLLYSTATTITSTTTSTHAELIDAGSTRLLP